MRPGAISTRSSQRAKLGAILALAFLSRLGYDGYLYFHHFAKDPSAAARYAGPDGYWALSLGVLKRGEYAFAPGRPETGREPLYPMVLAAVESIFGTSYWPGLFLNALFGALTSWLLYLLALRQTANTSVALLAALLAALDPEWVFWSGMLYRETFLTFLLALWLLLDARAQMAPTPALYAGMGAAFGALALCRSPFIPLGAAYVLLAASRLPPAAWQRTLGTFVLTATLFQIPWVIRNERITGHFVPGASIGGFHVYAPLRIDYSKPEMPVGTELNDPLVQSLNKSGLSPEQKDRIYYAAAWKIIRRRPLLFLDTFRIKAAKLWRPYPHPEWRLNYPHSFRAIEFLGLLSNLPLWLLGLAGLWLMKRQGRDILLPAAVLAVMTVIYGVFWGAARFHAPLVAALIVPAALAALRLKEASAP
jgi:hypothetical protein